MPLGADLSVANIRACEHSHHGKRWLRARCDFDFYGGVRSGQRRSGRLDGARDAVGRRHVNPADIAAISVPSVPEPCTPTRVEELFCDHAILGIDKPAGLPVHPSSRYVRGTVVARLREQYGVGFAAPVHRLDRETSGVMICARRRETARALSMAFERRAILKEYWALCEGAGPTAGHPAASWPGQTVDAPIASGGPRIRIGVRVDALEGKQAATTLLCAASFKRGEQSFSLWRAWPHTGRRHQVRIHLRHLGWPIVGDKIYGPDDALYEKFAEGRMTHADWEALRLPRQALHAACLHFQHPVSGERVRLAAPMPKDLQDFMAGKTVTLPPVEGWC